MDMCAERGMQVVLDMHRLDENQQAPDLWWDEKHSTEELINGWNNVIGRLKNRPNFMGVVSQSAS